jgi:hypothetical protein
MGAPASNQTTYVRNPHGQFDSLGLAPECPRGKNGRGAYDFREPNPNYPPDEGAAAAMRSAPIAGNIDCSEMAEYILREGGGEGTSSISRCVKVQLLTFLKMQVV